MIDASKYALVDLHLHVDGSLTPADVVELARLGGVTLPTYDLAELRSMLEVPKHGLSLKAYLDRFRLPLAVMQTRETIALSVERLVRRLDTAGLIYAELRFAPQQHTACGLTQADVVAAAVHGLRSGLAACEEDVDSREGEGLPRKDGCIPCRGGSLYPPASKDSVSHIGARSPYPPTKRQDALADATCIGAGSSYPLTSKEDTSSVGVVSCPARANVNTPAEFSPLDLSQDASRTNGNTAAAPSLPSSRHIKAQLILCCMRGHGNEEANRETVRLAAQWLGKGVCAADLAGAEADFPTAEYAGLCAYMRELAVPFTFHAGEAAGPESVMLALDYGASRIGHGIRCHDNPAAKARLRESGIPLEICPTSNLDTRALPGVARFADYPLQDFIRDGVSVTINTDNMAVSATTLKDEFAGLLGISQDVHGLVAGKRVLSEADAAQCVRSAISAAFLPAEKKTVLLAQAETRMLP